MNSSSFDLYRLAVFDERIPFVVEKMSFRLSRDGAVDIDCLWSIPLKSPFVKFEACSVTVVRLFGCGVSALNERCDAFSPVAPLQFEKMSVVVDTLRVNGNSCGKSNGKIVFGAGSVYNSFRLFARFF